MPSNAAHFPPGSSAPDRAGEPGGSNVSDTTLVGPRIDAVRLLPRGLRWVLTLVVCASALDDTRSLLGAVASTGPSSRVGWGLVGVAGYTATALLLAYRPRWAPVAFVIFLAALPLAGVAASEAVAALTYLFLAVGAFVFPMRLLATMLLPWLAWRILSWIVGADLGSFVSSVVALGAILAAVRTVRAVAVRQDIERADNIARMWEAQRRADLSARREAELREGHRLERRRLSRELHDVVAHELTRIAMQSASAGRSSTAGPDERDALSDIGDAARLALAQMRRLVALMNADDEVGEPSEGVGAASLTKEIAHARDYLTGLGISVEDRLVGNPQTVTADLVLTASQVLREATTNVVKHGRPGIRCEILVAVTSTDLTVRVRNELGEALLDLPESGFGLQALSERVSYLEGTFTAGPVDGAWEVEAVLPLR